MRNGHVDRGGGTKTRGVSALRESWAARSGPRDHGESGEEGAGGRERTSAPGSAPATARVGSSPGRGRRAAGARVCVSRVIYGGAAGTSAEAAAAAGYYCGSPHLHFLFAPRFFSPHTRPWGAGPPASTFSPLGPVDTSCRLPGRGLRGRRVPQPLAWRPGLAARSPGWRCATLAPTDSGRACRCPAAPRRRATGRPGAGRGRRAEGDVVHSEARKSSRFVQVSPGKARSKEEQCAHLLSQRDLGGEGGSRELRRLAEPLSLLPRLRPGGWSRRPRRAGLGAGFPSPRRLQAPSPWGSLFRPRHPRSSGGAAARAGGAERPVCSPGPGRDGRARWNPASSSARGPAAGRPPRAFRPGGVAEAGGDRIAGLGATWKLFLLRLD